MRSTTRSVYACARCRSRPSALPRPSMLELYHSVNSVCAQKVRIVLAEKGPEYREHLMTLRCDQFDPQYVKDALGHHEKLLKTMDAALERGSWLAGGHFSLADAAVIPYILRLDLLRLRRLWERMPRVEAWYERMRARPSVKKELVERMSPQDKAPFEKLEPDPWPLVERLPWAA